MIIKYPRLDMEEAHNSPTSAPPPSEENLLHKFLPLTTQATGNQGAELQPSPAKVSRDEGTTPPLFRYDQDFAQEPECWPYPSTHSYPPPWPEITLPNGGSHYVHNHVFRNSESSLPLSK